MPRETSAAIGELFRGFSGYVQADASRDIRRLVASASVFLNAEKASMVVRP